MPDLLDQPAIATPTGTEVLPFIQGGTTKQGTLADVRDYVAEAVGDASTLEADLALTASGKGAEKVAVAQPLSGAVSRTLKEKVTEIVSSADFAPGATGLNAAFSSAATYSAALARTVHLPAGTVTADAQVRMRKGQALKGQGVSTFFDLSDQEGLTVPAFRTGLSTGGASDSGGLPVEVASMLIHSGPNAAGAATPVFDMAVPGYFAHELFFTGSGVCMDLGGGDGVITGNICDLGVNHFRITGRNLILANNLHYLGNIHVTVKSGAVDFLLSGMHSEYAAYYGVLFETGATGARNARIVGSTFIMNSQTATAEGAIVDRSNGSEFSVFSTTVRNHYGTGIKTTNANSKAYSVGFVADGLKTDSSYTQGTTMKGLHAEQSARFVHKAGAVRNCGGQPIEIAGNADTRAIIQDFDFVGNTGGTAEIKVSNSSAGSKVFISGVVGDGTRPLLQHTGDAIVYVDASSCFNFPNPAIPAVAALTVPKTSDVVFIQGGGAAITSIVADAGNANRRVTFVSQGGGEWTKGNNLKIASTFSTTADDTITLVADPAGAVWYEASRSVN